MQERTARSGFTTIELLVLITLTAILVGILVYGTGFVQKRSRNLQRKQFMKEIAVGLEAYKGKNENYPIAGDSIPGGAVVSGNNNFNSVMAALSQGDFLDVSKLVDPGFGPIFREFNGVDGFYDGTKFTVRSGICQGNTVKVEGDVSGEVSYAYYSADGESYVMCLVNEGGQELTFVSPKED